jgi:hypothetical protein
MPGHILGMGTRRIEIDCYAVITLRLLSSEFAKPLERLKF